MTDSRNFIFDEHITEALAIDGWDKTVDEGRVMLFELALKVQAGYYVSYTEGRFLDYFNFINKDRRPSKICREFLYAMISRDYGKKSTYIELLEKELK